MTCKNCGHPISGNYCTHCGQSAKVNKITFTNFLEDISEGVFQVNKGFFYTFKELSVRPGHSIKAFLKGKRKRHFKPIAYVLTLSTLYFLVSQLIDQPTWIDDGISGFVGAVFDEEQRSDSTALKVLTWFSKNYAYVTLLLLPLFSLASYLSFRKLEANYLEHIVLNAYITGHQAVLYILSIFIRSSTDNSFLEMLPFLFSIAYLFWVFRQFFSSGNRIINFLRSTLTYVLYFIFSLLLLAVVLGIAELAG